MTGMETALTIESMRSGSDIRATPPWARMSAGTRSRAMTAEAPAASAMRACSSLTTSMMTPPLSIWASPVLSRVCVSVIAVPSLHFCHPDAQGDGHPWMGGTRVCLHVGRRRVPSRLELNVAHRESQNPLRTLGQ
ncbi:Uncharacterised protein [Mycobacteroides abscessus subsp. abscessus]|nr:Uncharacterised protein [Mycobacteroides abscessus subsp. abscessus]